MFALMVFVCIYHRFRNSSHDFCLLYFSNATSGVASLTSDSHSFPILDFFSSLVARRHLLSSLSLSLSLSFDFRSSTLCTSFSLFNHQNQRENNWICDSHLQIEQNAIAQFIIRCLLSVPTRLTDDET
jgi:hypothetical protein